VLTSGARAGICEDGRMSSPDPRAVTTFRLPAAQLRTGDLVNLSPGEDDWQQVLAVYAQVSDVPADDNELRDFISQLDGRYVLIEVTDVAPVDEPIYLDNNGTALTIGAEDGDDQTVTELISTEDGVRRFVYTRFELVTSRNS
jgi:hypothetical protein